MIKRVVLASLVLAVGAVTASASIYNKKDCLKARGEWGAWSKYEAANKISTCRIPAKDAGKKCRDGKDCSLGRCEYNPTVKKGQCTKYDSIEGCHTWVENGEPGPAICVD